jgi:hypothetical protein
MKIVDAPGIAVLKKLLIIPGIFAEIFPKVKEDAFAFFFDKDFVAPDSLSTVIDCDGSHGKITLERSACIPALQ